MNAKLRTELRSAYLNLFGSISNVKPGIHILNAHYVQPGFTHYDYDYDVFCKYMETLVSVGCKFMRIEDATKYIISGKILTDACYVAFTFDDGYEEKHSIIAPILEKYNTNAAFFINSNYISSSLQYQQEYNKMVKLATKTPLSWDQVRDLNNRGHIIGGHTLDHNNLKEINIEIVKKQVILDKINIEEQINTNCEYFAWPYGSLNGVSESILKLFKDNYKFIYSSDNWTKYLSLNKQVINRRHIESFWPKYHIQYFLSRKLSYE